MPTVNFRSTTTSSTPKPLTRPMPIVVAPSRGWVSLRLYELWEYRELLYFLVWRDVKVRYKQTVLGVTWAIIQPVLTMIVFSIFFGKLANIPSDGLPYPIMTYVALLPWQYFASSLAQSSNSVVGSANLIRKVYFPRLAVPIASTLVGAVDFLIAFLVLIGLMIFFQIMPTFGVLLLPLFLGMALATALGVGLWLAALNVKYRDVRYIVPFAVQFWMFATPIVYPSSLIPKQWRVLYGLNPMAGVIEGFRWALLGSACTVGMILVSTCVAFILLVSGAMYFRYMERGFADVV